MRLSYSVQSICGLIQQKQQTMFKFNFYLNLTESFQSLNLEEAVHWTPFLWPKYAYYYNRINSALQVSRSPSLVNVGLLPSSGSDWWHHPPTPNSLQRHICSRSRQLDWTNGRYRAALAAKKQIGKPGRSQISPNYT